ncbi:hypothetical protein O185_17065 [Photorhabdus temperata J3]|uniref:Uncharacterized protein n=1 Tax=Photorhabdus temperata J3 TaxID=1389415 RepID=U7QZE4_PHOTE|nr:hypothetical protein O185_17065 [Photorhabdus temperata J3]
MRVIGAYLKDKGRWIIYPDSNFVISLLDTPQALYIQLVSLKNPDQQELL